MLDRPSFRPVRHRGRQPSPHLSGRPASGFSTTRPALGSAALRRHECRSLAARHGALA